MSRAWVREAVHKIEADFNRSADTHLFLLELPALPGIELYLKDESTHPTGSLKHRLARSLFLYGLCNGWIDQNTTIIEASSGNTAVSEAYFARILGLPFIAVMPKETSLQKIAKIEFYGGRCHLVDTPDQVLSESRRLAAETGGHFMDQFTYAERATDWRGNNNIAESIFGQMVQEKHSIPSWIVCGAGTGGTSATIGRFLRYQCHPAQLCVVDPQHSVYYDFYQSGDPTLTLDRNAEIEGIGRPRIGASFMKGVIDRMIKVPDAASIAAIHLLERLIGRKCGGSTGTNLYGVFQLLAEMKAENQKGSVVTLLCDPGERYLHSYYSDDWLVARGLDITPYTAQMERFYESGDWRALE